MVNLQATLTIPPLSLGCHRRLRLRWPGAAATGLSSGAQATASIQRVG
jgi:hypothetical protein